MVSTRARIAIVQALCASLASLLLGACAQAEKKMAMAFPPATVKVQPVTVEPYREKSEYIGTLKSRKSVTLNPHIEGHVTQIFVNAGELVPAGRKIMQIDSRMQLAQTNSFEAAAESVQSDLASAKAALASLQSSLQSKLSNVEFTRAQYSRYQNLASQGAVAQSELDSWKNSFAAAQADRDAILQQIEGQKMTIQKYERQHKQAQSNLQAQKEQLRYYEIVAPFTGMIGDIPVKVGDHVTTSTALTTLTENHPLEVYISVPAEKVSSMNKGMTVSLFSGEGKLYGTSRVVFIAPTVEPSSQTVLVKTIFENEKNQLRADQTVRAQVIWNERDGISIPTSAVSQTAGKVFVFLAEKMAAPTEGSRAEDEKKSEELAPKQEHGSGEAHAAVGKEQVQGATQLFAKQVEIEVYGIEAGNYQVKKGLKPGDRIICTGIQRLVDGAPIIEKTDTEKPEERKFGSRLRNFVKQLGSKR